MIKGRPPRVFTMIIMINNPPTNQSRRESPLYILAVLADNHIKNEGPWSIVFSVWHFWIYDSMLIACVILTFQLRKASRSTDQTLNIYTLHTIRYSAIEHSKGLPNNPILAGCPPWLHSNAHGTETKKENRPLYMCMYGIPENHSVARRSAIDSYVSSFFL